MKHLLRTAVFLIMIVGTSCACTDPLVSAAHSDNGILGKKKDSHPALSDGYEPIGKVTFRKSPDLPEEKDSIFIGNDWNIFRIEIKNKTMVHLKCDDSSYFVDCESFGTSGTYMCQCKGWKINPFQDDNSYLNWPIHGEAP